MLQNAYFAAKIGADTAENEQHFAEILPIGRRVGEAQGRGAGRGRRPALPARRLLGGARPAHGAPAKGFPRPS